MAELLVVESSIFPQAASASRETTAKFVADWLARHPGARVVSRDLAANPPSHIGPSLLAGAAKPAAERSADEQAAVALSEELIAELLAADVIVIGAPMYNFSVPSTLKSWIDAIALPGRTFRYKPDGGVEGLVTGKKAYVIASRGGIYSEGPMAGLNFQDTYLRGVLGFLGITDVEVVAVEGQQMGAEAKAAGQARAARRMAELLA